MTIKPKSSWNFRSSDEAFDGVRILREAEEGGLDLAAVRRNGQIVIMASRNYVNRIANAGLGEYVYEMGNTIYLREGTMVVHYFQDAATQQGKFQYVLAPATNPHKLHADLLEAEAQARAARPKTKVFGY